MTAILHTGTRTLAALTATSAESAYPVSNLQSPAIRKPWRSTSTATQNIDIDLGSAVANPIICLQGCNASSITVSYGTASYTTVSLGALATAQDRHGTRRLSVSIPASARYVRLVFGGTPADAAAYWWGGALRPVSEPCPTVATAGAISLILEYYGNGRARPVTEPLPTVTCRDRFALIKAHGGDVLFRMLRWPELAAAQGFLPDYRFTGSGVEITKQIGNAVPRRLARAIVAASIRQDPDVSFLEDQAAALSPAA